MTDIDDLVARNQRRAERTAAREVEVDDSGRSNLTLTNNYITVSHVVTLIDVRDIGDTLISGHPAFEHGSGIGVSGDRREAYNAENPEDIGVWTDEGQTFFRDRLVAESPDYISQMQVGTGDSDITVTDDSLDSETGTRTAWQTTRFGPANDEGDITATFRFQDTPTNQSDLSEGGLLSNAGLFALRFRLSETTRADKELRITTRVRVEADAGLQGTFTEDGVASMTTAFGRSGTVGFDSLSIGTGTSEFQPTDSSLSSPLLTRTAIRRTGPQNMTLTVPLFAFEPKGSLPVSLSEIGVEDDSGTLVWASTFDPIEKDETRGLRFSVGFEF